MLPVIILGLAILCLHVVQPPEENQEWAYALLSLRGVRILADKTVLLGYWLTKPVLCDTSFDNRIWIVRSKHC